MNQSKIMVVEDDPDIAQLLAITMKKAGFDVAVSENGNDALNLIRRHPPDLVILDLMLPGIDGFEVCKEMKREPKTADVPVLILTARGEEIDRIIGLELGADDYLAKPFNPRELLARIKAILRRCEPPPLDRRRLQVLDVVIDLDARSVESASRGPIDLTSGEFDLFACLLSHPGRVLSRDQLMDWTRGRKRRVLIAPSTCSSAASGKRSKAMGKSSSRPSEMQATCSPNP